MHKADILIIGSGLAGLVAAHEATNRGRKVIIVDQEGPQSIGGQAFWSLGGLFMVDTPEQRRLRIRDSAELALSNWMGSARFDRPEDALPRQWAESYVAFASGPMRDYLHLMGMRWFPVVGWAERGGMGAEGHGNTVPRFHITWGTGEGIVAPFLRRAKEAADIGLLRLAFRHRVTDLIVSDGQVKGVSGVVLADDPAPRGASTTRKVTDDFDIYADSVIIASGGIGGDHEKVRARWPTDRLGPPPKSMIAGVPDYVDGQMQEIAKSAGARAINEDRMWHYCEGIRNWNPIWPKHGIRILPGPSSIWLDARGTRMDPPCLPGFDTLATLRRIRETGHDHSWFILTQKIIEKEFALSGSEQNLDLTSGKWLNVLRERLGKGATSAVEAFKEKGPDFIVARDLETLVARMNALTPQAPLDHDHIRDQIAQRDAALDQTPPDDAQIAAIRHARTYLGDRLIRTARPHAILDPANGPLIAVHLNILTRKSLGGLQTDLSSRVLRPDGLPFDGLFAAGEVAGFGGGGCHGYNALEGTFLGGCILSGLRAGETA